MKRTDTEAIVKCNCCGSYEPECGFCGKLFRRNQKIICDDEQYDRGNTKKHFCLSCYKKVKVSIGGTD